MKLPSDSIGISDLLDYRECPQRFSLGMKRHERLPDGRSAEVPGHTDWKNAYGSAIHDAIHLVETAGLSHKDAVTQVWPQYMAWLDPEDLDLLYEDLDKYQRDTPLRMELIAAESDARVPLFQHEGRMIYFRFKLDALYRRVDDHTVFFHRDYKSSKWRKTQLEVDNDPQMWAYCWAIHELYPECSSLLQSYEQLRFGNLLTSKNEEQRAAMKAWLIESVRAVLADDTLAPKQNEFCAYCPLVVTCDETRRATRYWKAKLAVIAPQTKEGRRTRIALAEEEYALEDTIAELPKMQQTIKHLKAAEDAIKDVLQRMPSEHRESLGWRTADRKATYLTPGAMRALHEALGDSFYEAVTVSKTAMEKVGGKRERALMKELELQRVSTTIVIPTKGA